MESAIKNQFLLLYKILTSKLFYHIAFWVALFLLLFLISYSGQHLLLFLTIEAIQIGCFMLVVYTNINILVPRYLKQDKILIYFIYLICLTLLITLMRVTIQYWLLTDQPALQHQLIYQDQLFIYLLHFLIGVASTAFIISSRWVRTEREKREIKTQQVESELKFLKTQINPHFLFNILNSLYALTLKKSDQAPEIVIKLSEMMRYMLYECNENQVPLSKEIKYIQNYLDLEKLRIGNKMDIHLEINGDPDNIEISPLIFVNFIENAFKHGGKIALQEKGFVHLQIDIVEPYIHFKLSNSKPQLPANSPDKLRMGGIGIKNVRERLNLLYPGIHDLQLKDLPEKYEINLKLNYIKK